MTAPVRMDTTRALGLMGLSNTRWMDASTGGDPKAALDKALFQQTQLLDKKRTGKMVNNNIWIFLQSTFLIKMLLLASALCDRYSLLIDCKFSKKYTFESSTSFSIRYYTDIIILLWEIRTEKFCCSLLIGTYVR